MVTAYFLTATIVCLWTYRQTRAAAQNIRAARKTLADPWVE